MQMPQPTQLDPTQAKAMTLMVKQAMRLLLQNDTADHIVAKAKAGDPRQAVSEMVTPLLNNIYQMAQVAGAQVSVVTLLAAGIQIVAVLAKMLEAAGVLTQDQIPSFCADVVKVSVDQHNSDIQKGGMAGQNPNVPTAPTPPGAPQQAGMMGAAPQPQGA